MKSLIVVTGGAGFIGSNLIQALLKNTNKIIISLDNYSAGSKKNHIINKKIKYIKGDTTDINKHLKKYKKKIDAIFHFGEFSRIYQSFIKFDDCYKSNSLGSHAVFKFCLDNNIKLIYSATSASLGGDLKKNLSPYSFLKAKNLEYLENLKNWFNFKYEIIYFYNVYGKNHIRTGNMATVIGIFENAFLKSEPIPIVRPGTQSRRFTHIDDTIEVCLEAYRNNKNKHYAIYNKKNYSILDVASLFNTKKKFLNKRRGERYNSSLVKFYLNNKIILREGKRQLSNYVKKFITDHQ